MDIKGHDAYSIYHPNKIGIVIDFNNSHIKIKKPNNEIIELPKHIVVLDSPKTEDEIQASKEAARLDDEFESEHSSISI